MGVFTRLIAFIALIGGLVFAGPTGNILVTNLSLQRNAIFERQAVSHILQASDQTYHMVYTDGDGLGAKVLWAKSQDGTQWSEPLSLSGGMAKPSNPTIIIDPKDVLTIFWADAGSIIMVQSSDQGRSWSKPFKVSGKFSEGRSPVAAVNSVGDIFLIWENAGTILYRRFSAADSTWSTIYDISRSATLASDPALVCFKDTHVYALWLERGEVVGRDLDLAKNAWGDIELISIDANRKLQTAAGASVLPAVMVDVEGSVHAVWVNRTQVLHRVRVRGYWSPVISRLSSVFDKTQAQPNMAADRAGKVYITYAEQNKVIVHTFNSSELRWEKAKRIASRTAMQVFAPQFVQQSSLLDGVLVADAGYSIGWVERIENNQRQLVFVDRAQRPVRGSVPIIKAVANAEGKALVSWDGPSDQMAIQVVVSSQDSPQGSLLFDSRRIVSAAESFNLDFQLRPANFYFFIRTQNTKGQWSSWSQGFHYRPAADTEGPEVVVEAIDEDSLYLYSPNPTALYYGNGLQNTAYFVIRGKVNDMGSGVNKVEFSPALGDNPPPQYLTKTNEWRIRYSIVSSDEPTTIYITAYDNAGHKTVKTVEIVKDVTPPEPPSWVKVFSNKQFVDQGKDKKQSTSKMIYATWADGKDAQSGIRYHLMGIQAKWWQNPVHVSGDQEQGQEGLNTFYVYAVDNVGNVSAAGTDLIFIDSIPPLQPYIAQAITSANYVMGTCSADTVKILVNGTIDPGVEMVSSGNWRYKHQLRDGQIEQYQFQAIDAVGNKGPVLETKIAVDRTPPKLYFVEHDAVNKTLRIKDTLTVTAKSEPGCQALFTIPELCFDQQMYDDGTHGDIKAKDGVYTGSYIIDTELSVLTKNIEVTAIDQVGNAATVASVKPLTIDSTKPILIDDFEALGDHYPWKNHAEAENNKDAPAVGNGALVLKYDFRNEQSWSGVASLECAPRNIYGTRAYLTFWLKGSGSKTARLFINLQGTQTRDIALKQKDIGLTYSVSLANTDWQKVSVPVADEYLDDLAAFTKYQVYVISTKESEVGECSIDDLCISYRVLGEYTPRKKETPIKITRVAPVVAPAPPRASAYTLQSAAPETTTTTAATVFTQAPFIEVNAAPLVVKRGQSITVTATMPREIVVEKATVAWAALNNKVQSAPLKRVGSVWQSSFKVPNALVEGDHLATMYIQTNFGRRYKKQFAYKVVDAENYLPQERIMATWYPHPLIAGEDARVQVIIPTTIKPMKVMVVLGEKQGSVYSIDCVLDKKDAAQQYWHGNARIPATIAAGEYSATVFVKTKDNRFYKISSLYAVMMP